MVPFLIRCDYVKGICIVRGGIVGRRITMPSDAVSLVTTGIGVSLLAGLLSGVFYVLAYSFGSKKRTRKRRKSKDWYCEVCGVYYHSTVNILTDDLVRCVKCGSKICPKKCSKFIRQQDVWICKNCLKKSESSWFRNLIKILQPNKNQNTPGQKSKMSSSDSTSDSPSISPDLEMLQKMEKEQVRDFIEKLVDVMLKDNVDNATVSMMYNDHRYLSIDESPYAVYAALKRLIRQLLREAVNLPLLENAQVHPRTPPEDTTDGTYEDLLATAIINKVVSNSQNNLLASSSNEGVSSPNKEYFFSEETLDSKWKTADVDTTSVSSFEGWLQSDSKSRKYVDKVTLVIKQNIEEVENSENEDYEDDVEYFRSSSSLYDESESNWVLQRRKFHGSHSPVAVPMLVPNPSSEAKVLIGDQPLDDTSDLSDIGSDYEEAIQPTRLHTLMVQSKNIIGGGKSNFTTEIVDEDRSSSSDSGVKEINLQSNFYGSQSLNNESVDNLSFVSTYSNTEKEAEYTEKYDSLPRPVVSENCSSSKIDEQLNGEEDETSKNFIGGSYSKKEKEKWKHAVELKNNPYSKESIEKRIQRSNSAAGSIFGPDYYARMAGKPSGGGKLTSKVNNWSSSSPSSEPVRSRTPTPPPELPKTRPPLEQISFYSPHIFPEDMSSSEIDLVSSTDGIHQAVKAIVTPEEEENYFFSPLSSSEIVATSDSDASFVNSYDVQHAQVIKKTKNEDVYNIPIKPQTNGSYKETPVARPRILNIQNKSEEIHGKSNRQKKDNTLISRIYKDPKVRLFAMNSREEILANDEQHHTFTSQKSMEKQQGTNGTSLYLNKDRSYSSDDGITSEYESGKTGKMSFFSSEEDLLSLNSETSFHQPEVVAARNDDIKINYIRPRSSTPLTPKNKNHFFNSQEDLLSIDETSSLPRRKDNTLISKIYQDPHVRHFAMKTHRDLVLEYDYPKSPKPSQVQDSQNHYSNVKENNVTSSTSPEISLKDLSDEKESKEREIDEVANKHVVSDTLEKLINNKKSPFYRSTSLEEIDNIRVSVWDLRKKFENTDASNKPVISSLTARSLSKQVKNILKQ
ncbi:hypothetical protein ABEB36_008132 [Hypothenemus hampei]|uniref:FYVE-type zinc finger domain-containing protein n=1 Tax=Hypothenemus hampei TaxID=57062 RepID=A0ABD1EPY4_HYPHA